MNTIEFIRSGYEIITKIDRDHVLELLSRIGRISHGGEYAANPSKFIRNIVKMQHYTILEHFQVTVLFTVPRSISHQLVRHRHASCLQESMRYVDFTKRPIQFIRPLYTDMEEWSDSTFMSICETSAKAYYMLRENGNPPEVCRSVLPNAAATKLYMTMNLRSWREFFALRALGTTGKPDPQMVEVALPLFKEMKSMFPEAFCDMEISND